MRDRYSRSKTVRVNGKLYEAVDSNNSYTYHGWKVVDTDYGDERYIEANRGSLKVKIEQVVPSLYSIALISKALVIYPSDHRKFRGSIDVKGILDSCDEAIDSVRGWLDGVDDGEFFRVITGHEGNSLKDKVIGLIDDVLA